MTLNGNTKHPTEHASCENELAKKYSKKDGGLFISKNDHVITITFGRQYPLNGMTAASGPGLISTLPSHVPVLSYLSPSSYIQQQQKVLPCIVVSYETWSSRRSPAIKYSTQYSFWYFSTICFPLMASLL
jgi:hypothetical protein